jgi:hypothetical protein
VDFKVIKRRPSNTDLPIEYIEAYLDGGWFPELSVTEVPHKSRSRTKDA